METPGRQAWDEHAQAQCEAEGYPYFAMPPRVFSWTPFEGWGPGVEALGHPEYARVLDLGCGVGDNAAYLSVRGNAVAAIDYARWQIRRARGRWSFLLEGRPHFEVAEAAGYLASGTGRFDVIYSALGAFDTTVLAEDILPALRGRITDGGVFAFSVSTIAAPQRRDYPPPCPRRPVGDWEKILPRYGLTVTMVEEVPRPRSGAKCPWVVVRCAAK